MKGFRKTYLRGQLPGLGLGLMCCAVFAVTFRLYGLPLGAVGYPAALCAVGWLLFAFLRGAKAARKHAALSALTAALTEDMLPRQITLPGVGVALVASPSASTL